MQHWRPTDGLTDEQVVEQIRRDGIHIMVYLAGLFDTNRLMVASYRPAPVQVSFHNGCTTGLEEMDYWITDELLHPSDRTMERFTETLYRLPVFYTFPIPQDTPPVSEAPVERLGFITFISLNNPAKINHEVIALWSRILKQLPDSRLILKYRNHFGNPSLKHRMVEQFREYSIDEQRLEFISTRDHHHHHLSLYHRADIALDPFPFTGATTTFQALWMGVPVISLLGDRFIARMAGDIIHHAGLGELLAESPDAYLERAIALAKNRPRLVKMRSTLRRRLETCPLCDGQCYAKEMEAAYRNMWSRQGD